MLLYHAYSLPPKGFIPLTDNGVWTFGYSIQEGPHGEGYKIYTSVLSNYIEKKADPLDTQIAMYKSVYGDE